VENKIVKNNKIYLVSHKAPGVFNVVQEPGWPILKEDLLWAYFRLSSVCPPKVTETGAIAPGPLLPI